MTVTTNTLKSSAYIGAAIAVLIYAYSRNKKQEDEQETNDIVPIPSPKGNWPMLGIFDIRKKRRASDISLFMI